MPAGRQGSYDREEMLLRPGRISMTERNASLSITEGAPDTGLSGIFLHSLIVFDIVY